MRILEVGNRANVSKVAYGREGRQLIAAVGDRFVSWSLETFERERVIPRVSLMPLDCLFVPGGRAFLEANGYWKAEDELPGAEKLSAGHLQQMGNLNSLTGFLCFAPDGDSVLRVSYAQPWQSPLRFALWDFGGLCVRTYPHAGSMYSRWATFSPDGSLLAIGGMSALVKVWDAISREQIAELEHTDSVFGTTFSPDGRRLATSAGRTVRIWSVPEGKCLHKFKAFRAYTECRAFSPDGTMLLAGSREGRVRIWEVESGRELCDHDWQRGGVSDVAFSPDGLTAAAACSKQAVVVWDVDF